MIESYDEGEAMVTGVRGKQQVGEIIIIVETGIDVAPSEETTVQVLVEYDVISRLEVQEH